MGGHSCPYLLRPLRQRGKEDRPQQHPRIAAVFLRQVLSGSLDTELQAPATPAHLSPPWILPQRCQGWGAHGAHARGPREAGLVPTLRRALNSLHESTVRTSGSSRCPARDAKARRTLRRPAGGARAPRPASRAPRPAPRAVPPSEPPPAPLRVPGRAQRAS